MTGHLEALLHMFAYLDAYDRSRLAFDPSYIDHDEVERPVWSDFYDVPELPDCDVLPPGAPEARGLPIQMTTFVDSDHAGDKRTRRSRTGVLIFLNMAPTLWMSRKQTSIETSSFGSEFSAMKTGVELSEGLRYKLQMMGIPLDGPTHVKADNMSVVSNTSVPESVLKKKSNSIAYHYVRECAARSIVTVSWERSASNLADMLTKIQSVLVRFRLARKFMK